ncbi:MAG: hypothetical protein VB084_02675 [Syntrophomonadaceae bacterium]|nr:hypothetical protein [Syntrophomonadaceae bacterium]
MDKIMDIEQFKVGQLESPHKDLLLRSDEYGTLSIGILINPQEVAIVAYSTADDVFEKMMFWADKVEQVKQTYSTKTS